MNSGIPLDLANERADIIDNLSYKLYFSVPSNRNEPILGELTAIFNLARTGPVVFDFLEPSTNVRQVLLDGRPVAYETRNEHVIVPHVESGSVEIGFEFVAGNKSLNRHEEFLYTLFVPDRARAAFPVFDQPNLKARYTLTLEVPETWRTVSNGPVTSRTTRNGRATVLFAETRPISTYLFSFVVGKFDAVEQTRSGRRMVFYYREDDPDSLVRNVNDIFDLHASALSWLEDYTGINYPFDKFDFVAIPSFQYSGMEHPGAILYRSDGLFMLETSTQNDFLRRASLIAHETAHQWFGDLVTMEWFDDVWMKETFANFLAAKIVRPSFPNINHNLRFLLAHYPSAYNVDRTDGANAIRQPLDNLNQAGTLYGPIIYQKAPIVVRQLERILGERSLRDGLRKYLDMYAYDNASWTDLIRILDQLTEEDLVQWSDIWVEQSGRPNIYAEIRSDGNNIQALILRQSDPDGDERIWKQRFEVVLGYGQGRRTVLPIDLGEEEVVLEMSSGIPLPSYILPNGGGFGYGLVGLDARSREHLLNSIWEIDDPLVRSVGWLSLWDEMLEGFVDPIAFIEVARRSLPRESAEQTVAMILEYLTTAYWRYVTPDQRTLIGSKIEELLWNEISQAKHRSVAAVYFNAYQKVVLTDFGVSRLERIWRGEESVPGVSLVERDFISLAQALAVREVFGSDSILNLQRARIENADRRDAFDFSVPALSSDLTVRDVFFKSLADSSNRVREPWVLDALSFLNHPLRAKYSERYLRPSLDLLEDIQRTGDIFFPERWLIGTLGGHQTESAAAMVGTFLLENPNLAPQLRRKVLQAADGLNRASRIVNAEN